MKPKRKAIVGVSVLFQLPKKAPNDGRPGATTPDWIDRPRPIKREAKTSLEKYPRSIF
jgi:hypothetical protein